MQGQTLDTLTDITRRALPVTPGAARRARVLANAAPGQTVRVALHRGDQTAFRARITPATVLPTKDDEALVVADDQGAAWIVAWWTP